MNSKGSKVTIKHPPFRYFAKSRGNLLKSNGFFKAKSIAKSFKSNKRNLNIFKNKINSYKIPLLELLLSLSLLSLFVMYENKQELL